MRISFLGEGEGDGEKGGGDIYNTIYEEAVSPEAEFLDVIGTKFLRVFLLAIHSHLYQRILPPHPTQKLFETGL